MFKLIFLTFKFNRSNVFRVISGEVYHKSSVRKKHLKQKTESFSRFCGKNLRESLAVVRKRAYQGLFLFSCWRIFPASFSNWWNRCYSLRLCVDVQARLILTCFQFFLGFTTRTCWRVSLAETEPSNSRWYRFRTVSTSCRNWASALFSISSRWSFELCDPICLLTFSFWLTSTDNSSWYTSRRSTVDFNL